MTPKQQREEIKRLLSLLNERNRTVFNLMYSPDNTNNDVNDTVDKMPAKKLNWALTQCQHSYYNLFKVIKGTK
jgi:hypothetical protein